MLAGVADTHIVLWYLFNDPRLSTAAGAWIDNAAAQGRRIGVSPITLAEIVYWWINGGCRLMPTSK